MRERFAQAYPTSFRRWEAARADEECDLPYAGSFGGSEEPFRVGAWCFGVVNRPVTRGIHH
jgi:hypothetical protein